MPCISGRAERRILILRLVRGADVHRILVLHVASLQGAKAVVAVVTDIGHVQDHLAGEGFLDTCIPLQRCRDLRVVLECDQRRDRSRAQAAGAERGQGAVTQILIGRSRWISGNGEDSSLLIRAIVVNAEAATVTQLDFPVTSYAKPRRGPTTSVGHV